ncbi:DUF3219 family protein [Falsibacillus pallidus]|uniref:DUF3219 family protein n=1 Tax=Falsibacillus pallidus TaxID=493781 RepID=UPI003D95EBC4
MPKEVVLNDRVFQAKDFSHEEKEGAHQISFLFDVTSEEYHDVATLLYEGAFDVAVPENGLAFRGSIQEYSTSVTNLYEKDQVGEYSLTLLQVDAQ